MAAGPHNYLTPVNTTATPKIGIIMSSIREGRFCEQPARWILDIASKRTDLEFEIVDLRDYPLPLLGQQQSQADSSDSAPNIAQRWRRTLDGLDGYIFLTAEYNHSITGVLKNALDHASSEFNKKPAAFVGYGGVGGARAVEQLRLICIEFEIAPTRSAVHIGMEPYRGVAREGKRLSDFDFLNNGAAKMLDELSWWAHTLRAGREQSRREHERNLTTSGSKDGA